jgi:hypothetical protein
MRIIEYRIYWSPNDFFFRKRKDTLVGLILDIPYLMDNGVIPPLSVLNEVLLEGGDSGGMSPGTKWKPFTINEEEYAELVKDLLALNPHEARKKHFYVHFDKIIIDEELAVITDYSTWFSKVCDKYRRKGNERY